MTRPGPEENREQRRADIVRAGLVLLEHTGLEGLSMRRIAHGRPDIMPGLDLGLVIAAQHLKKLRTRPDAKRLLKIAEAWRPWRSAAALLLWHYRRNMPDWSKKE